MGLQIFSTRKCPETRKAERFFKERGAKYQFIDLADPLLLKTPIVRDGRKATVGYSPEVWEPWLKA